jgi:hypothetical protein
VLPLSKSALLRGVPDRVQMDLSMFNGAA